MNIKLTVFPSRTPQKIDGLLWGSDNPISFTGLTEDQNGLISQKATYLFRAVCYLSWQDCFRPRRLMHVKNSLCLQVVDFPDSDPFEIIRIDRWCTDEDINEQVNQMRTEKVQWPLPGDFASSWGKLKKEHLIEIGEGYGLDTAVMTNMEKVELRDAVLRKQAESSLDSPFPAYGLLYSRFLNEGFGDAHERASEMANSIRYAVKYTNREILYLSDLERRERKELKEHHGIETAHARTLSEKRAKAARKKKKVTPEEERKIIANYRSLRYPKDSKKKPESKNNAGILTDKWIRRTKENGGLGLPNIKYCSKQIQRMAGDTKN